MGVRDVLARSAVRHAHVLIVEVPGHWQTRAAVERSALERGWRLALSPADADVLAVCGEPGPRMNKVVDLVWHQMPGPRVRVAVSHRGEVPTRLDEAYAGLLDTTHHRDDAHSRPAAQELLAGGMDHGGMDRGGMDHTGMDHTGMDHTGMDHGGMEMSPGGIPLAAGGEDRDGLEMDVLNVRLGPTFPHWPAGLVLRCALQGDVIADAEAELLDDETPHHVPPSAASARRMDNIAALLAVSGWEDAAAEARVIRDSLLDGGQDSGTSARTARLLRRVRRSWVLRWSLRGIRPMSQEDLRARGLPPALVGDTYDRLLRMLEGTETNIVGKRVSVDQLARMVTGLDLAAARLVLASLDLGELRMGHAEHEAAHA